jgi:hypothetical protein
MLVGFVAIFIFPFFALAVILVSAFRAWRHRRPRALLPAAGVLVVECLLLVGAYREWHRWDGYEFNPPVTAEDLAGRWQHGNEAVSFRTDGTFISTDGSQGHWSRDGECCLRTWPAQKASVDANAQEWAAVRKQGDLLLLKVQDLDPDNWNPSRAFSRRP